MFSCLRITTLFFVTLILYSCSTDQAYDRRSGPPASIQIALNDLWDDDQALALTSTVAEFEILINCDGGYTQTVKTTEFSMPLRNTNCVAKLVSFSRDGKNLYRPKVHQDFTTWLPADRAVFTCSEGSNCAEQPDLSVYVLEQLPAPNLTVFAQIRYKFAENSVGAEVHIQKSDLMFSRVVVGDEPPPLTLRAAMEGAVADQLELIAECDTFQIGITIEDAICNTTALHTLRVALVPIPEEVLAPSTLARLVGDHSRLLAADDSALLVRQGQWGIGRGGYSVRLPVPVASDFLFVMSTDQSDSYTYHRVKRASSEEMYTIGGMIHGLPTNGALRLTLNGAEEVFSQQGVFSFTQNLARNTEYIVQALHVDCAIAAGSGVVDRTSVTDIVVNCSQIGTAAEDDETADTHPEEDPESSFDPTIRSYGVEIVAGHIPHVAQGLDGEKFSFPFGEVKLTAKEMCWDQTTAEPKTLLYFLSDDILYKLQNGHVKHFAGNVDPYRSLDHSHLFELKFDQRSVLRCKPDGLYVSANSSILKISPDEKITPILVRGKSYPFRAYDSASDSHSTTELEYPNAAQLQQIYSFDVAADGTVFGVNRNGVIKIQNGQITAMTLPASDNPTLGKLTETRLPISREILVHPTGDLYVVRGWFSIVKISDNGQTSLFYGTEEDFHSDNYTPFEKNIMKLHLAPDGGIYVKTRTRPNYSSIIKLSENGTGEEMTIIDPYNPVGIYGIGNIAHIAVAGQQLLLVQAGGKWSTYTPGVDLMGQPFSGIDAPPPQTSLGDVEPYTISLYDDEYQKWRYRESQMAMGENGEIYLINPSDESLYRFTEAGGERLHHKSSATVRAWRTVDNNIFDLTNSYIPANYYSHMSVQNGKIQLINDSKFYEIDLESSTLEVGQRVISTRAKELLPVAFDAQGAPYYLANLAQVMSYDNNDQSYMYLEGNYTTEARGFPPEVHIDETSLYRIDQMIFHKDEFYMAQNRWISRVGADKIIKNIYAAPTKIKEFVFDDAGTLYYTDTLNQIYVAYHVLDDYQQNHTVLLKTTVDNQGCGSRGEINFTATAQDARATMRKQLGRFCAGDITSLSARSTCGESDVGKVSVSYLQKLGKYSNVVRFRLPCGVAFE